MIWVLVCTALGVAAVVGTILWIRARSKPLAALRRHLYESIREVALPGEEDEAPLIQCDRSAKYTAPRLGEQASEGWDSDTTTLGDALVNDRLLLFGPTGVGKTELLMHLSLVCLERAQGQIEETEALEGLLPLYVPAHRLAASLGSEDGALSGSFTSFYCDWLRRENGVRVPNDLLEREMAAGRCLVLVDGLDDITRPGMQTELLSFLDRLCSVYPSTRLLVTARRAPRSFAPSVQPFRLLQVLPLAPGEQERALRGWLAATGLGSEKILERTRASGSDFGRWKLAATPLTALAQCVGWTPTAPRSRSELLRTYYSRFLAAKTDSDAFERLYPGERLELLSRLALYMHRQGRLEQGTGEIVRTAMELLPRFARDPDTIRNLLQDGIYQTGLMTATGASTCGFSGRSIQEYFAAEALLRTDGSKEFVVGHLEDSWWANVIALYAGMTEESEEIVRAAMEIDPLLAASLVSRRINLPSGLLSEIRGAVEDIVAVLPKPSEKYWQAQRLLATLDPGSAAIEQVALPPPGKTAREQGAAEGMIDRYPVSTAEYLRFLAWRHHSPERVELAPVAWGRSLPTGNQELAPVAGVPLTGAETWAALRGRRLPTEEEWNRGVAPLVGKPGELFRHFLTVLACPPDRPMHRSTDEKPIALCPWTCPELTTVGVGSGETVAKGAWITTEMIDQVVGLVVGLSSLIVHERLQEKIEQDYGRALSFTLEKVGQNALQKEMAAILGDAVRETVFPKTSASLTSVLSGRLSEEPPVGVIRAISGSLRSALGGAGGTIKQRELEASISAAIDRHLGMGLASQLSQLPEDYVSAILLYAYPNARRREFRVPLRPFRRALRHTVKERRKSGGRIPSSVQEHLGDDLRDALRGNRCRLLEEAVGTMASKMLKTELGDQGLSMMSGVAGKVVGDSLGKELIEASTSVLNTELRRNSLWTLWQGEAAFFAESFAEGPGFPPPITQAVALAASTQFLVPGSAAPLLSEVGFRCFTEADKTRT